MACLAVFDIDGTLSDTNAVDDACFVRAVSEFLGVEVSELDWSGAPHVTDSGLLPWLCAKHRARPLDTSEVELVVNRFLHLMREQFVSSPHRFQAIPGASRALSFLPEIQWDVALATGAWKRSAQFKLSKIGVDVDALVLATANDAVTRTEIVRSAIEQAEQRFGQTYIRIVSIGDAPWDVRTAVELDLPFVGIGRDQPAQRLRAAGATTILDNLADLSALRDALERASIPAMGVSSVSA